MDDLLNHLRVGCLLCAAVHSVLRERKCVLCAGTSPIPPQIREEQACTSIAHTHTHTRTRTHTHTHAHTCTHTHTHPSLFPHTLPAPLTLSRANHHHLSRAASPHRCHTADARAAQSDSTRGSHQSFRRQSDTSSVLHVLLLVHSCLCLLITQQHPPPPAMLFAQKSKSFLNCFGSVPLCSS